MTDRSAFAEVLYNALKEKGFKYPGKIHFTDEEFDAYKDLSPKEMAEKYIVQHNLVEKRNLLIVLREIHRVNQEGKYSYNMRQKMEELNLSFKHYFFLFRNAETGLTMQGEKLGTRYIWTKKEAPIMSDAEEIYEEQEKMRKFRFEYKEIKYVEAHIDKEPMEIVENLKKKKDIYELGALFQISTLKIRKKSMEKQKEMKAKQKVTFEKEIARKPAQQMGSEQIKSKDQMVNEAAGIEKRDIFTPQMLQNEKSCQSEGMMFIYMQKSEMFQRLAMQVEGFNKRLEAKIGQMSEQMDQLLKENGLLKNENERLKAGVLVKA